MAKKTATRAARPASTTTASPAPIPEHKYRDLRSMMYQAFPEVEGTPGAYDSLLSIIDGIMPGPNFTMAYGKVREEFQDRVRAALQGANLLGLPEGGTDLAEHSAFLAAWLRDTFDGSMVRVDPAGRRASSYPEGVLIPPSPLTPQQRPDWVLIDDFLDGPRDEDVLLELEKRSKSGLFLAYAGASPLPSSCDRALTLELLKNARKGIQNPRTVEGRTVYSISQVDLKNRVRHECPLCPGTPLVRGTCPRCRHDFSGMTHEDRQVLRLGLPDGPDSPSNAPLVVYRLPSRSPQDILVEACANVAAKGGMEVFRARGLLPTLLMVDDPVVVDDPVATLRAVDAFHRPAHAKRGY